MAGNSTSGIIWESHAKYRIGTFKNDMASLHELTFSKMADLAGRLVYNNKDEVVFNFGKHRGKAVAEILQKAPSYYDWMMKGDFTRDTKRRLTEIKLQMLNL